VLANTINTHSHNNTHIHFSKNKYNSIKVEIDTEKDSNSWLTISLTEGKNREIRKIMEHIGLQVNRLIRVSFGPFVLGNMKVGEVVEVSKKALKASVPDID
jgi:23S rRNA pseudouridine2605 synthase